jgi:hypothetical protein
VIDPRSIPVRFSNLKRMADSPAHYMHGLTAKYDSPAMRLGRLVHAKVFTNTDHYAIYDGIRRGKEWAAFRAEHDDVEIFTRAEEREADPIVHSLAVRNRTSAELLGRGAAYCEKRIEWEIAGRACAGTPDLFNERVLVDLKTTASAKQGRWLGPRGEIRKRAYHAQLAWYLDGLEAAGYLRPREAFLIAVETREPYQVVTYRLCDSELEAGRRLYRSWFEQLRVCEESNAWPGYAQCVVDVEAPEDAEMPGLIWDDEETEEQAA